MKNRIVVMGGSFNPPTIAHLKLMQGAVDAVNARLGIFVPAAQAYVARKMKGQKRLPDTLSEPIRLEMLKSLCSRDARLTVSSVQFDRTGRGYDYEMLLSIQEEYPDDELYFVIGSDKLYILPRWHRIDELLRDFQILAAERGEDDLEKIRNVQPYIAEHWNRFTVFPIPDGLSGVSSSAFREKLRGNDRTARELVTAEVWEIMNKNGKVPWNAVTDFHAKGYEFLSNFYEASVTYQGLAYGSVEAAFQAQKCMTEEEKLQFTKCSPGKSKEIGRRVQLRPDWEQVKVSLMEEIVREKFAQHPDLAQQLRETGDKILVEGNRWGDAFWGVDAKTGQGGNHLGKILMKIREELNV